jgi:hypothetical protein
MSSTPCSTSIGRLSRTYPGVLCSHAERTSARPEESNAGLERRADYSRDGSDRKRAARASPRVRGEMIRTSERAPVVHFLMLRASRRVISFTPGYPSMEEDVGSKNYCWNIRFQAVRRTAVRPH